MANSKLQDLQAEEKRLAAALSAVRTNMNELTAVASLPTEILEEIFGICVSWLYGHQKPKDRLAWTQVCRTWRHISLNSARLWRCIDLCDSRLAQEFLIRSKTAPISIVSASPLKLCIENLHSHASRLEAVDVFLFPNDMNELFVGIGPNLTNLTNLSLKIPPVSTNFVLDINIPRVSRLVLDCVAVPWDACRNLSHFSLRGLGVNYSPTIQQLCTIFESSPQLEYLRLDGIVPSLTAEPPIIHPVSLPRLREAIILGKAYFIHSLLSVLVLPNNTRLQLHCSAFDSFRDIFPSQTWLYPEIDTLRLGRRAVNLMRTGAGSWTDEPSNSLISISWSTSEPVLSSLNSVFNLARVTTLELSAGMLAEIPPTVLVDLLAHVMNLESLHVAFNALDELVRILTPNQSSISDVLCPRLKRIQFGRLGDTWWHFNERWAHPILALGKARQVCLVPLHILEFRQCHGITPHIVGQFEGVIPEINNI